MEEEWNKVCISLPGKVGCSRWLTPGANWSWEVGWRWTSKGGHV